jgi:hypothetical protein
LHLIDTGLSIASIKDSDWGETYYEPSLVLGDGILNVHRGGVSFHCTMRALFSMHAITRRLQRCPGTDDDALLADIGLLALHDAETIGVGKGFVVHTAAGRWTGRCIRLDDRAEPVLSVRTWLAT